MIETQDHDQGPRPLPVGRVGALVVICVDGYRWAMMPPGDPLSDHLAADPTPTKKPAAVTTRDGLDLVSSPTPLTKKDSDNERIHGTGWRV